MDRFLKFSLSLIQINVVKSTIQNFCIHFLKALPGFIILFILYFAGEWLSGYSPIPIPGAVVGMIFMFLLLYFKILPLAWVETAAGFLLAFMGLFYIPFGVGIIDSKGFIQEWGWQIIFLVLITVLTVFYTSSKLFQILTKEKKSSDE